eukprot:TRINITY_DN11038_c0_g1_i4.p1 TRINITY_DN11038_c0_g1~~TRINITY_DN11038_c0_g1_i4.p1  ORF type:complete len:808 (+),score=143.95 TRINITY_DN11038_c0_g1_i4:140-2563(+)
MAVRRIAYLLLCSSVLASAELPFQNVSLPWDARVADLVGRLTLDEKIAQLQHGGAAAMAPSPGIDRLGIKPFVWGSECVTGLGTDDTNPHGTAFPQSLAMAATFDPDLIKSGAQVIANELRGQNNKDLKNGFYEYHFGLSCWSPVVNIDRHPLWGRNQETFGECPVLSSFMANAFVSGLQGNHSRYVAATAACKHLDAYGGPDNNRRSFDANVTQHDLVATFLPAFEECAMAGALGYMCSFNSIRGVPACANYRTMNFYARQQWNFTGYIVSDQDAIYTIKTQHHYANNETMAAAVALNNGCDLEDADNATAVAYYNLPSALDQGLIQQERIDESVSRLFYVRMRLGEFDPAEMNPYRQINESVIESPAHVAQAQAVAEASIVLLRNVDDFLPLSNTLKRVCLIGPFGDAAELMYGKYAPHGSQNLTVTYKDALVGHCQATGCEVVFEPGCSNNHCTNLDVAAVTKAAKGCDVVLAAVGTGASVEREELDRTTLDLPGQQNQLLDTLIMTNSDNIVIITTTAGPVQLTNYSTNKSIKAIMDTIYLGQTAGAALVNVLFGAVSPSGRLPFSWPASLADLPPMSDYTMKGRTYRYNQSNVLYPFGHGLSYTTFSYTDLSIPATLHNPCQGFNVTVTVANSGSRDAHEAVQVYMQWPEDESAPVRQLASVQRVWITAGDSRHVTLHIRPKELVTVQELTCSPPLHNHAIGGDVIQTTEAATWQACCNSCSALGDVCEGYRYYTSKQSCQLINHRRRGMDQPDVISADVAPVQRIVKQTLQVSVGGGQPLDSHPSLSGKVQVEKAVDYRSC